MIVGRVMLISIFILIRLIKNIGLFHVKDTLVKYLSGGEKRKLSIGISMINDPDILVLDEPTYAVDPSSRESIYELITQNRKSKFSLLNIKSVVSLACSWG